MKMRQKGFSSLLVIILVLALGGFIYLYVKENIKTVESPLPAPTSAVLPPPPTRVSAEPYYPMKISAGPKTSQDITIATGAAAEGTGSDFGTGAQKSNNNFAIEIELINNSFSTLKVGSEDFTLLDPKGNKVGKVAVNDGYSPYIPDGGKKVSLSNSQAIRGYLTFYDIPKENANIMEDFTLRYLPEKPNATPIEIHVMIKIPITG